MFFAFKTVIAIFISLFLTYFLNKIEDKHFTQKKIIITFFIAFISLEYWLLGSYSYINFYDEADIALSRILHDKYHHIGGKFLHNIQGGADFYASHLIGGQYFSLERVLFYLLPPWLGLLSHKVLIIFFNFFGYFLIIKKNTELSDKNAFFISSYASVFNSYTIFSTIQHGIGYALIPLSIYFFIYMIEEKKYFLFTSLFSVLIAASTSITHSFLSVGGGILLFSIFFLRKNIIKFIISFTFLIVLMSLNWSEVIFGLIELGKYTEKLTLVGQDKLTFYGILGLLPYLFWETNLCLVSCNYQYSPYIIIFILLIFLVLLNYEKKYLKLLLIIFLILYSQVIGNFLIKNLGLNFLTTLNISNFVYFLILPVIILASKLSVKNPKFFGITLPAFILFFAILTNLDHKINISKKILQDGGQNRVLNVKNLKNTQFDNSNYRFATTFPHKFFHPNFLWIYGHETIDGYVNMIPKIKIDFWRHGIFRVQQDKIDYDIDDLYITYTSGSPFQKKVPTYNFNSKQFNLNDYLDLNILRMLNVKFINSYFPLEEDGLKLISGEKKPPFVVSFTHKIDLDYYYQSILELKSNFINPPNLYIYEIENPSDKFYFPSKIEYYEKSNEISKNFEYFSNNYSRNTIFLDNKFKNDNLLSKGEIIKIKKIINGYEVLVDVEKEGLLVFNQFFLPYWKIYVGDTESKMQVVNYGLLSTNVKKGRHSIKFMYERELFREKILNFVNK